MLDLTWFRTAAAVAVLFCSGTLLHAGAAKSSHPLVPGFERFYAAAEATPKAGQLLLGELNCISCHLPSAAQAEVLSRKQAPILDAVGARVKPAYMREFLSSPHTTKPGTTMPDMFASLPEAEKKQAVEALVHFLASTGTLAHEPRLWKYVGDGHKLYNQVGCIACHGTRKDNGDIDQVLPTSVRLADLADKYSIPSLTAFLENPHGTRPSGRMPSLLNHKEARDIANFLLQSIPGPPANSEVAYYEGNWSNLPDFSKLKPKFATKGNAFDIKIARRKTNYALRFEGYVKIPKDGDYRFFITSDDGSELIIDGERVVINDGLHPPSTKNGNRKLKAGMHKLVATFFQGGGGDEFAVHVQGPGLKKTPLSPFVYLTDKGNPQVAKGKDEELTINAELVVKGRALFASMGCASCHQLKEKGKAIASTATAKKLADLQPMGGCLSSNAQKGVPSYHLSTPQQAALASALKQAGNAPAKQTPGDIIVRTMTTLNCYACHERDKVGGVENDINKYFLSTQQEMGDEGRIPPLLTGVGAKLTTEWLKKTLAEGANDRPYMLTRMPKFGADNAGHLLGAFQAVDSLPAAPKVAYKRSIPQVKSVGRHLVGEKGLSCISCHTYKGIPSRGVQGMDMTILTQRLKRDWFHYYLLNPNAYRPGTRMPTAWPDGKTLLPAILDGDTDKQIESIWLYLSDGPRSAIPLGIGGNLILLQPDKEAIIYRNFVQGAGSRAIAVGYPELAHLAFDANNMRLALLWQGAFMDAAKHWTGRGVGYQPPLGDNVLALPEAVSFAPLKDAKSPWPGDAAKSMGYHFKGYSLSSDQRPTFLYSLNGIDIEDFPNPHVQKSGVGMRRAFKLRSKEPTQVWYRAATGSKIEADGKGWYSIDGRYRVHLESDQQPVVRSSGNQQELLVPLNVNDTGTTLIQEYTW